MDSMIFGTLWPGQFPPTPAIRLDEGAAEAALLTSVVVVFLLALASFMYAAMAHWWKIGRHARRHARIDRFIRSHRHHLTREQLEKESYYDVIKAIPMGSFHRGTYYLIRHEGKERILPVNSDDDCSCRKEVYAILAPEYWERTGDPYEFYDWKEKMIPPERHSAALGDGHFPEGEERRTA